MAEELPDAPWATAANIAPPDAALPDAPWAKKASAPDLPEAPWAKTESMPGPLDAALQGFQAAGSDISQSKQAITGEKITTPEETSPASKPFEWSDLTSPYAKGLPKVAYSLAKSSPTLAAGVAGGAGGTLAAGPVGGVLGGMAGAGAGAALQAVGPAFAAELKNSPNDPDGAWKRAVDQSVRSGAFSALGWGLFPAKFVEGPLKNLAFQAFGIQPAVSMTGQAAQNIESGKPITEGLGQAYAQGAVGTAIPAGGHVLVRGVTTGFKYNDLKGKADQLMDGATGDVLRDIQMKLTPMAARDASSEARAVAKDFANQKRASEYQWSKIDEHIEKNFTPEQREKMWEAADAESVSRQMGQPTEGIGLSTLEPAERRAVELLQSHSQQVWQAATDLGMVKGDGLPSYTPRMFINAAEGMGDGRPLLPIGRNLQTTTPQMKHREHLTAEETEAAGKAKFGEGAELVRDIRTLGMATAKMQDAVAGRTLIEKIREIGKNSGQQTVSDGVEPTNRGWFTIPQHPAFKTMRYSQDANGNTVRERIPMYVRDDFEGPLRSVLSRDQGKVYNGLMSLKGRVMSAIMYSPLIHNAVEYGRALPAMPGKVATFQVYFEGNRAKNDPVVMQEAVGNGLVPIGKRGYMQDITSLMEQPNLTPGRSWTAKVLSAIPDLFSKKAGDATRRAVDRAGDIWHNTLLWDRVADLQMGLYTNFKKTMEAKGIDSQSASRAAAHLANRYAGALPLESMSEGARKFANLALFSRSYTLGNIGAMKDMFVGLPKDVQAQVLRDVGAEGLSKVKSYAQRKAISAVMLDVGLMYLGNSFLQDAIDKLRGERGWGQIGQDYLDRMSALLKKMGGHPFEVLTHPLSSIESLSSTSQNEPGKSNRIIVGYQADGTAIYARNPVGKIGEEMEGWATGPLDMIKRKLGTVARPIWQIMSNDEGFGRKVYNPDAKTTGEMLRNVGNIATTLLQAQTPSDQFRAASDLYRGAGDAKTNLFKILGPMAGLTFSKGAPGGPGVGLMYNVAERQRYELNKQLPEIRRMVQEGNEDGARDAMTALNVPRALQNYYVRTTQDPSRRMSRRAMKDFKAYSTEEEKQAMERYQSRNQ